MTKHATRATGAADAEAGAGELSRFSAPVPAPRVRSQAEYGYQGHLEQVRRHGEAQVRSWLRRGGRPRDPSLAEIMAATTGNRARQGRERRPRTIPTEGRR